VATGIGDDCAVLRVPADKDLLVTTDFSLEGVHFRREWHPAEAVGHRCLARGLSDIAAMGGEPTTAFLSLGLPSGLPQIWVDSFMRGLMKLARKHGVILAGGDTTQSPKGILVDIIVLGSVLRGKAILRSGAQPGNLLYVSGELGGSAAAVFEMEANPRRKVIPRDYRRHFNPEPRIELGRFLGQCGLATAMIDTSDGLSSDVTHICEESGVGAELDAGSIPQARVGKPACPVGLDRALHGGEDYELLFTAPASKRVPAAVAGVPITRIGRITRGKRIMVRNEGKLEELAVRGWEYFRQPESRGRA
jgi:thiamine-monophosphate kinase